MAGGDELVRVARNKNATLKFLCQNCSGADHMCSKMRPYV